MTNPNEQSRTSVLSKMPAATRLSVSRISSVFINTTRLRLFVNPYARKDKLYLRLYRSVNGMAMLRTASGNVVAVAAKTKTKSDIMVEAEPAVRARTPETGAWQKSATRIDGIDSTALRIFEKP